jgi:glutamate-1-semialdehyde 2,1-aminomutase
VTPGTTADTLLARYNDVDSVKELLRQHDGHVAAIIVEPIAGNMGVVAPAPEFLSRLRGLCDSYGSVLIFD